MLYQKFIYMIRQTSYTSFYTSHHIYQPFKNTRFFTDEYLSTGSVPFHSYNVNSCALNFCNNSTAVLTLIPNAFMNMIHINIS